ncbi:MAG: hypothetical protein ACRCYR_17560, partial [Phycicoccus sp.]
MFDVITDQPFRFDSTLLLKANAYPRVRAEGPVRLYQMALYLHVKEIVLQVSQPGDEVFFIAGHLQTNAKPDAIYEAVRRVCAQLSDDREMVPCVWDAPSSWGIQVWPTTASGSVQRTLLGKPHPWHARCIEPKGPETG